MKINVTTLGCPKNIVDSEILLGGLQGSGVQLVDDPLEAETIILNTCGFIQGAKEESIDAILQAVELKKQGFCRRVFVTGCLSQRYSEALQQEIPEVDGYFGNRDMQQVLRQLLTRLDLKRELLGERQLTTPPHFAYLKISEGCENPCTFCAIPGIRGGFRSRPVEDLVEEAHKLANRGVKELILIAQDSTIYGRDYYGEPKLIPLLQQLAAMEAFVWIRLLYTFPAHFSDELIDALADLGHVIPYIDMPIQHVSDRLLRHMARKVTRARIEDIIASLRDKMPGVALRTSLIVGFPGETESEHQELLQFVEQMRFERLGLFTYSREEGTPAYDFKNQVADELKQEWLAELQDVQTQISYELNQASIGTVKEVVVEEYNGRENTYIGRTAWDCPEIDNSVIIKAACKLQIGAFYDVKICDCSEYEVMAEPVGEASDIAIVPTVK